MEQNAPSKVAGSIRGLTPASKILAGIACIGLFAMMLLTFVDVIGRYVFLAPLPAAYEIISLIMPCIIFCSLPLTVLRETHVTVDLLDSFLPYTIKRLQVLVVNVVSALALALVSWRLWVKGSDDYLYETVTDELLLLVWPFGIAMSVLCGIAAICALGMSLNQVFKSNNKKQP